MRDSDKVVRFFSRFEKTDLIFPSGTGNNLKTLIQEPCPNKKLENLQALCWTWSNEFKKMI